MKIRRLPFIICSCFLLLSAITSCLDNTTYEYEYSSNASILAFSIDTVRGVTYPFTIDQTQRLVYNADSLPVGTDLTKIKVSMSIHGYVTSADTIVNLEDSIDFTNSMEVPLEFTVVSPNLENEQLYHIWINVHQQEPDTLIWNQVSSSFSGGKITGEQKTVSLDGTFLTYYRGNTVFKKERTATGWSEMTLSGFPSDPKIGSLVKHGQTLYVVTDDGGVYASTDGLDWSLSPLSGGVQTLITGFPSHLIGIVEEEGESYFKVTYDYLSWEATSEEHVDDGFPLDKISSVLFENKTGKTSLYIMSENLNEADTISYTWFTDEGLQWASTFELSNVTSNTCPRLEDISMIWYDHLFYAFGGKGEEGFLNFFTSMDGIYWNEITEMVGFPEEFNGRGDYSFVVDEDQFIWIFWSATPANSDEVWKGRINRLGFIRQ